MFSFFKRKKKADAELVHNMFAAASFRDSLNNIITTYNVELRADPEDKLVDEVINVVALISGEAVSKSERRIDNLGYDEVFICLLIALAAANHISMLAHIDFEVTSATACIMLAEKSLNANDAIDVVREAIHNYNLMSNDTSNKTILAVGNQVAQFFQTANEKYLDNLSELYTLMIDGLE